MGNNKTCFAKTKDLSFFFSSVSHYFHLEMANTLPNLEVFSLEGESTSVGLRWEKWKRAFKIYLEAASIDSSTKKRATLLHFGGIELQEIFYNLPGANVESSNDNDVFSIAIEKLDEYFSPKQSKVYERHIFRLLKQEGEI